MALSGRLHSSDKLRTRPHVSKPTLNTHSTSVQAGRGARCLPPAAQLAPPPPLLPPRESQQHPTPAELTHVAAATAANLPLDHPRSPRPPPSIVRHPTNFASQSEHHPVSYVKRHLQKAQTSHRTLMRIPRAMGRPLRRKRGR